MSLITDAERTDLHTRLRDVLGSQEGDTLMAHLPPIGWADVATKQDLAALREIMDVRFAQVNERFSHIGEQLSHFATKADMERGFRRQAMWVASVFLAQQASFIYMVERLAR